MNEEREKPNGFYGYWAKHLIESGVEEEDDIDIDDDEDALMNLLIGIKALHHHRCHALFKDFEKVLASSKKTEEAAVVALANAAAAEQLA